MWVGEQVPQVGGFVGREYLSYVKENGVGG